VEPDFEKRFKEAIAGVNTGIYSIPTQAARLLNMYKCCDPNASISTDHINFLGSIHNTNVAGKGCSNIQGICH